MLVVVSCLIKLIIIEILPNFFVFFFHHQLNLVWELVLASSGSNPLPIAVAWDRTVIPLPSSASIITEQTNDWLFKLAECVKLINITK
jgi:hypothetical protein